MTHKHQVGGRNFELVLRFFMILKTDLVSMVHVTIIYLETVMFLP